MELLNDLEFIQGLQKAPLLDELKVLCSVYLFIDYETVRIILK